MNFQTAKQRDLTTTTASEQQTQQAVANIVTGIGGSAKEAIGMLMKSGLPSNTHVSFIDADASGLEGMDNVDKLLVNEVPAADMLDEMDANPNLCHGDEHLRNTSRLRKVLGTSEFLSHGLQTARVLGLLVMLYYLCRRPEELLSFLSRPFRNLLGEQSKGCSGADTPGGVAARWRIVITYVFGCGGGTGGGLAQLFADLTRTLLRIMWGVTHSEAEADIFLPGAKLYQANSPTTLLADTYATLKEIVQRILKPMQTIRLASFELDRSRRPFARIMLFDDTNLVGRIFKNSKHVAQIWALTWWLRNIGAEGAWYRARLADYRFPDACSSFSAAGAVELCIFADEMAIDFALRTAQQVVAGLNAVTDQGAIAEQAQQAHREFLNRQREFADVPTIQSDPSGKRIEANVNRFAAIARTLLPQTLDRYARQNIPAWHSALEQRQQMTAQQMKDVVIQEVGKLLNRPEGMALAIAFLTNLTASIEGQRQSQQQRVERADAQQQQHQSALDERDTRNWLQKISLAPRREYLELHQTLLDAQIEAMRQRMRLRLIAQILEMIQSVRAGLLGWQQTLSELVDSLMKEQQSWQKHIHVERPICEESVLCPSEIESLYNQDAQRATAHCAQAIGFVWSHATEAFVLNCTVAKGGAALGTQAVLSDAGIGVLVDFCQEPWQYLYHLSVEDTLRQQGRSPEAVLDELMVKAAPLVAINEAKQIPAEQRLMVLSSETCAFFDAVAKPSGLSTVATGKKQRLSFLYTVHGFNPFNLAKAPSWQHAYEQLTSEGFPLHPFADQEEPLSQADYNHIQSEAKP